MLNSESRISKYIKFSSFKQNESIILFIVFSFDITASSVSLY